MEGKDIIRKDTDRRSVFFLSSSSFFYRCWRREENTHLFTHTHLNHLLRFSLPLLLLRSLFQSRKTSENEFDSLNQFNSSTLACFNWSQMFLSFSLSLLSYCLLLLLSQTCAYDLNDEQAGRDAAAVSFRVDADQRSNFETRGREIKVH